MFWTIWIKSVETRVGQNFLNALRSSSHCHVLSVCLCHFHWLIPGFIYCFAVSQSLTLINGRSMKIAHFSDVNWSTNLVVINRLTFLSLVSSHAVSNCTIIKISWVYLGLARGTIWGAWQNYSFSEGFVAIQASIVRWIHVNGKASKHLVDSLLHRHFKDAVLTCV